MYSTRRLVERRTVDRIRHARRRLGLSQEELAEASGVSAATIVQVELGHRRPQGRTLRKLAAALGVEVADLLEEEGPPKTPAPPPDQGAQRRREFLDYIKALDRDELTALSDRLDEDQMSVRSASELEDVTTRGLMVRLQMRILENPDAGFVTVETRRAEAERKLEALAGVG
jgi:transcriptional regulator with XRE-family HTH domain